MRSTVFFCIMRSVSCTLFCLICFPKSFLMSQSKVIEINDSNFGELISSYKLVIVDFWAEWCGPCRMLGPVIEEIAVEYADKFVVGKVNVDNNAAISSKFSIRSIPVIIFFKDGEEVDRIMGYASKAAILERLSVFL